MKRNMEKRTMGIGPIIGLIAVIQLASCSSSGAAQSVSSTSPGGTETAQASSAIEPSLLLDRSGMFTERDLEQTADLSEAAVLELSNGEDVLIDEEGIYVLSGDIRNTVIIVDVDDEAKVQLVLDELNISNENSPAIYVKSADKVFITTKDGESSLAVSGTFEKDGDTNLDAVIFSRSDLVINGTGHLRLNRQRETGFLRRMT
jgi:hypothetical protein